MISDLVDSDGMGWTDSDGDMDATEDPIVTSITFGSQTGSQLVGFVLLLTTGGPTHNHNWVHWVIDSVPGTVDNVAATANVAGFNKDYDGMRIMTSYQTGI